MDPLELFVMSNLFSLEKCVPTSEIVIKTTKNDFRTYYLAGM
jgi:hypothetical protein